MASSLLRLQAPCQIPLRRSAPKSFFLLPVSSSPLSDRANRLTCWENPMRPPSSAIALRRRFLVRKTSPKRGFPSSEAQEQETFCATIARQVVQEGKRSPRVYRRSQLRSRRKLRSLRPRPRRRGHSARFELQRRVRHARGRPARHEEDRCHGRRRTHRHWGAPGLSRSAGLRPSRPQPLSRRSVCLHGLPDRRARRVLRCARRRAQSRETAWAALQPRCG